MNKIKYFYAEIISRAQEDIMSNNQTFELINERNSQVVGYISKNDRGFLKIHLTGLWNKLVACDSDGQVANVDDFVGSFTPVKDSHDEMVAVINCEHGLFVEFRRSDRRGDTQISVWGNGEYFGIRKEFTKAVDCTDRVII
jgi:hypothetical protein